MSINDAIHTLLNTRPGEKIGVPGYGCGIWERLDKPAQPALLISDIVTALETYEPRACNVTVEMVSGDASGAFEFEISYDGGGTTFHI